MRFGVIGTNFITREFLQAGQSCGGFSLRAVYSRRMETAEGFAAEYGAPQCFDHLDDLARDDTVDAVYIASPNACHAEQAAKMLAAGKHVLLEKPACLCRRDFLRLMELARENRVVLLEAMRTVFTPGFAALQAALPTLGALRRASFIYCQYSSRYDAFQAGTVLNAFDPRMGSGALMDIGVYCVSMMVSLLGKPLQVQAAAMLLANGLDAQGAAVCGYDGLLADLSYSKVSDHRRPSEVQGEDACLLIEGITNPKRIVWIARDGRETTVYYDPDPEFFGMRHEIAAFMAFAQTGGQERYNERTAETLGVMDDIRLQTGIDFIPKG